MDLTTGIRRSTLSQPLSSLWPTKLRAKTPVTSRMMNVNTTPSPGIATPSSVSGRYWYGISSKVLSSVDTIRVNTQMVMPSGTHSTSPVTR